MKLLALLKRQSSFNRYMVECELVIFHITLGKNLVLIDTWWNVNTVGRLIHLMFVRVLIDTWWNVNSHSSYPASIFYTVLIDTWWNVNKI